MRSTFKVLFYVTTFLKTKGEMSYSAIDMLTGEGFNEQYAFNQVAYLKALERARKHLSFQNGQLVFLIKNGSDIYIRRFIQVHFRNVQFME